LFLTLLAACGLSASGAELKINFSSLAAGEAPTNFHSARAGIGSLGDWKIIAVETPPAFAHPMPQIASTRTTVSRHGVLAQMSDDPTESRYPMLIYDSTSFKQFKLTTSFKIVSGVVEQMAGVVFRYQNPSNFYVVRASALGHNLRFYAVTNNLFQIPVNLETNISTGEWHTLSVECNGNRIDCQLDGAASIKLVDSIGANTIGKVGFWTKSDSVTYFGDTKIEYKPLVPAAQMLVDDILKKHQRILGLRIYTPDEQGQLRILASKDLKEIGQPATDAEKNTFEKGTISLGHGKGTVAVDMPLNDRNGEAIATVRVQLKSYSMAETTDTVLDRVRVIVGEMQLRVLSKEDLMQ
jgi:hypothetical protein